MSEARIGRILVASLHQAIADILPDRLEFYENWLSARQLRGGTIGLAAVSAVLSFLRGEGDVYEAVVRRAGQHAADWTLLEIGRVRRAMVLTLPRAMRVRLALALARRTIRSCYVDSRAKTRVRRGVAYVDLRGSLFCEVRDAGDRSLCGFYLALTERLLQRYNVAAQGAIEACRGTGSRGCALALQIAHKGRAPVAAAALLVTFLVASGGATAQTQAPVQVERLLVVPFENLDRDPGLYWLSEGSAILLTDALIELGAAAVPRSDRVQAFEQLQLPAASVLSRATVIKVGQLMGASRVIGGSLQRVSTDEGDALLVRVRSVQLDTGRLEPEIVERARIDELFDLFHRVGGRLLGRSPTTAGERPPPAAFEQFVKGLLAETPQAQVRFLEAALRAQPSFQRARLALWEARTELGEHAQALAIASAVPADSRWSRRARFAAALSLVDLRRYDEAFDAFAQLQEEQPAAVLQNNLGVVQLRRGSTAHTGKPAYYFDQAIASDPTDSDFHFNLGYAYAVDSDPQAAIYWLRETVRRNTADAEAHFLLGAVLQSAGNLVEARREQELARQLSASYEALSNLSASERSRIPAGLERLKRRLDPFQGRLEATITSPAQRDLRELAAFHLERGRRFAEQDRDREAVAELRRTVYLAPYDAEAHLLLGRVYLRTGRVTDAVDAFKISVWSQETASARVALGEAYLQAGDLEGARREAERALTLEPESAAAKALRSRLP
jgi:tetratricopeptide (TPR) repeat protein